MYFKIDIAIQTNNRTCIHKIIFDINESISFREANMEMITGAKGNPGIIDVDLLSLVGRSRSS
jgi:hypothetical protein